MFTFIFGGDFDRYLAKSERKILYFDERETITFEICLPTCMRNEEPSETI